MYFPPLLQSSVILLTFHSTFAHLNTSSTRLTARVDHNHSANKLMAVIEILVKRINIRVSIIIDPEAMAYCEHVARTLHAAAKSCIRVYHSDGRYSENPFSQVNILCFRTDENFIAFVIRNEAFRLSDAFYIILVSEEVKLERARVLLFKNFTIMPHTVLIHEDRVRHVHRSSRLTGIPVSGTTSIRDIFGISSFGGRPLRVTQFSRIPEVTPTRNGFMGSSYNVVMTLAKHLNFTPIISNSTDGERFGDIVNGTFTGALGDVVHNRADMVMNGHFLQELLNDRYWYTVPVNYERICVVLPKAGQIPKYRTPFMSLSASVWLSLEVTFVAVCCVHYVSVRFSHRYVSADRPAVDSNSILTTLSATLNIPLTVSRFTYPAVRLLLIVYLGFMHVLVSSFKAFLVTLLTVPMYYKDKDLLEELKEGGRPIELWTYSKSILRSFRSSELRDDPILSELGKNAKWADYTDERSHSRINGGLLVRFLDSQKKNFRNFIFGNAESGYVLHRMRQCPMSYYVAYLIPKSFPFVEEINTIIARVIESGLVSKWDTEVLEYTLTDRSTPFRIRLVPSREHTIKFDSQLRRFSMEHLQVAFYILLVGWSTSVCVFAMEMAARGGGGDSLVAKILRSGLVRNGILSFWKRSADEPSKLRGRI